MADNLISYYDEDRDAVIIMHESGSEIAVMDCDEAESLADEIAAASRKESTGYKEWFAQQDDA